VLGFVLEAGGAKDTRGLGIPAVVDDDVALIYWYQLAMTSTVGLIGPVTAVGV
jgi:hypothetical protein